jgi:DNA-binding MarR family transcriptional regulator
MKVARNGRCDAPLAIQRVNVRVPAGERPMKHFDYAAGPGTEHKLPNDHADETTIPAKPLTEPTPSPELAMVLREQQISRLRGNAFPDLKLRNALWDMLLELLVADHGGQQLSMSDLCGRSAAPESTALRLIHQLRDKGYVNLVPDKSDRRRTIVSLTVQGRASFGVFLSEYATVTA